MARSHTHVCSYVRSHLWVSSVSACWECGTSLTSYPEAMSSAWHGVEQKSEAGVVTGANDDPNAAQECQAGLAHQDPDDQKDGHEDGQRADAHEEEREEEDEQGEGDGGMEHEEKKRESGNEHDR